MQEDKKDKQSEKAEFVLDLGLGGIFKGLTDMVGQLSNAVGEIDVEPGEKQGEFTIKGLGDEAKGVYGFSIRTATGGKTKVEPFGNIRRTEEGAEVADSREPLVDVYDEENEIIVTAELPGVSEGQIEVTMEDDILSIQTNGDRKYAKEILLPASVSVETMTQTYNNGILELRLSKKGN